MAILIVEHNGTLEGASLSGRILIGRRASNHVVIDDPAVSRIHAWIDTADRQFCLTDAGSRTGTFVNGQRVAGGKVPLRHGDRITIGPASLIFRADATLPAGVSQLNFAERTGGSDGDARGAGQRGTQRPEADGSILFDCPACRSPLWIAGEYAGRMGKCRFCATVLRVPDQAGAVPGAIATNLPAPSRPPVGSTAAPTRATATAETAEACGACQSPIESGERSTTCPECGLTFHADCWAENYGCSAYGCSQVNVLLPKEEAAADDRVQSPPADSAAAAVIGADTPNEARGTSEYALLAVSVAGVLLGALTFGIPALLVGVAAVVYIGRRRGAAAGDRRGVPRVALAAAVLAIAGALAGAAVSYVWWMDGGDDDGGAGVVRSDEQP